MPDITMCSGANCQLKEKCYRYTAKPSMFRQSYFIGTPNTHPEKCDHFWDNKDREAGSLNLADIEDILD
jgi:hypothetical protein